jgi:hypothetical protein
MERRVRDRTPSASSSRSNRFSTLREMFAIAESLWPADEFANFENGNGIQQFSGRDFKKQNFVRWAVTKGLDYQTTLGENPYKLGFLGGTDAHNGTPSDVVEDNYVGSHGGADDTPEARLSGEIPGWITGKDVNAGGHTGVYTTKLAHRQVALERGTDALRPTGEYNTASVNVSERAGCAQRRQERRLVRAAGPRRDLPRPCDRAGGVGRRQHALP